MTSINVCQGCPEAIVTWEDGVVVNYTPHKDSRICKICEGIE